MPRKKKKKPRQQRAKISFPARYGVGDRVRVKPGTTDPDFPDIPLGGWAGAISEVNHQSNPPIYLIEWNKHTLDHMHPVYLKRCERDDLEADSMWLGEADLEPDSGVPAVIEQPTSIVAQPLNPNDEDDRVRLALGLTCDDPLPAANAENLRRYGRYLLNHLSFPFLARYTVETSPFEETRHVVNVVGLLDADDCDEEEVGVCPADQQSQFIELPLAVLEVTSISHNRQLVEDYSYWFGNWPSDNFTAQWIPSDNHTSQPDKWSFLKTLVRYGLYGAAYGVVLGSLVGALEGAMTGALVGAIILGLVGCAAGAKFGMLVRVVNRVRYGSLAGGTLGALAGVLIGAVIGAMAVAFAGTLIGGIVGVLAGRLLVKLKWKLIGSFTSAIIGSGVGAVVMACYRDQEKTLEWGLHGAWIGACVGALLVFAAVGSSALAARNRNDG